MSPPPGGFELIYVDSDSSDGSALAAERAGAKVVLRRTGRLTAGLARNAGWRTVSTPFILFMDGDCTIHPEFVIRSLPEFENPQVAAVCGLTREMNRYTSVYDRVMEFDRLHSPPGPTYYCSGNVIFRRSALEAADGFDPDLISFEEPDLCTQLRKLGWVILRLGLPMVEHDLSMTRLSQYCRRFVRQGYGCAEVSDRHSWKDLFGENWAGTSRIWGTFLAVLLLVSMVALVSWGTWTPLAVAVAAAVLLALRTAWKYRHARGDKSAALIYGFFWVLKQMPTLYGQLLYWSDKRRCRKRPWITYK